MAGKAGNGKKKAKKFCERLDPQGNFEHVCAGGNKKYVKCARPTTKRERRGF